MSVAAAALFFYALGVASVLVAARIAAGARVRATRPVRSPAPPPTFASSDVAAAFDRRLH